jgi:polysaccharide biosynthesis protein PslH
MTPPGADFERARALFLSPEAPERGGGGGALRSASLLEYLRTKYSVDLASFSLKRHSKNWPARAWRNFGRLARGVPPLFDRYSGYEEQIERQMHGSYALGMIEHFWCASYEPVLRTRCAQVVLDLHNIESELAQTHSRAARWPESWASARFAEAYRRLEREWLPRFDAVLVASEEDRSRIRHARVCVYPNALPAMAAPVACSSPEEDNCIVFSGNLEYHPNIEAVRWFREKIWPHVRERDPLLEWRLIGRNPEAVERLVRGDPRIRFTGAVENALDHIARAKVCVVPLLSASGTRFKILEAWAAGRAVVSTTLGAEGLQARDGRQLAIADSPEKFVDAIALLLADAEMRRSLGEAGRALYLEKFTWDTAWRSLEEAGI